MSVTTGPIPQGQPTGGQAPPNQAPTQQGQPPANGPQDGQPAGQQQGQAPAPQYQPAQQQPLAGQAPPQQDVASLPQWAQDLISRTRSEAGAARTQAKEQAAAEAQADLAKKIGVALGITPDGQPPDPAVLQAQITAREGDLRKERVENAAYRAATRLGANPDALLDSRAFLDGAHQLDPNAADFTTRLDAAVTAALTTNPLLKAAPQPGAAPPPFAPNPGQQAGNGIPPAPSTVSAGAALYASRHPKNN